MESNWHLVRLGPVNETDVPAKSCVVDWITSSAAPPHSAAISASAPRCGHRAISYNSCRNRHCPKCQTSARDRWIARRQKELLPTAYVHVVFTLSAQLALLALQNKSSCVACCFGPMPKDCPKSPAIHVTSAQKSASSACCTRDHAGTKTALTADGRRPAVVLFFPAVI